MRAVLITGASDGIGKATAMGLALRGWRVLLHGRSQSKLDAVAADIKAQCPGAETASYLADFSNMRQVNELASQLQSSERALDVLINNAGVYMTSRQLSKDGFEMTWAVNHFAHFLLTEKLRPLIEQSGEGRIINVSSIAHASGQINLDDLTYQAGWSGYRAYADTKLANILHVAELSTRLPNNVTANVLHPGVINTKLLRQGFGMVGRGIKTGAKTSIYLAASPEVTGISGCYFKSSRLAEPSAAAKDKQLARELWQISEDQLKSWL
jgi:retinol dehydrogenase 14